MGVTIIERLPCSCSWPESCGGAEEMRCQAGGCQCGCGHSRPCGGCADCPPYVCPGCYAVGGEPHGAGCIDGERERKQIEREIYGGDDDTWDDEDEESDRQ